MKNNIIRNIILCFLASVLTFLIVPVYMIGINPEFYEFVNYKVFILSGLLFTLLFGVLLSILFFILYLLRISFISRYFPLCIVIWVAITGFFVPVCVSAAMIDPEKISINYTNLIIALFITVILIMLWSGKLRKYVAVFLVVAISISTLHSVYSIYNYNISKLSAEQNHKDQNVISNKKNIIVVSFDGVPGETVNELIENNKKYAGLLKDFVLYKNAVSQADATYVSMVGELLGTHDFKARGETLDDLRETLEDEGIVDKILLKQISDSYQYNYGIWGKKYIISTDSGLEKSKLSTFDYFRYSIARIWTNLPLKLLDWESDLKYLRSSLTDIDISTSLAARVENGHGPKWDRDLIIEIDAYNAFVDQLDAGNKELSIRYVHFTFTHFPMDFDENCNYRGDDKIWFDSNQNQKGIMTQGKCVLKMIEKLIVKIKKLKIYNNSLIVIKSDHGKPTKYYCDYPYNQKINDNPTFGFSRFNPFMLIKDFKTTNKNILVKDELVLLNDLAVTLCNKVEKEKFCEIFPGVDLLGGHIDEDLPYFLYVVKNTKSNYFFKDHISVKVPTRKISLIEAMKNSPYISLSSHDNKSVCIY